MFYEEFLVERGKRTALVVRDAIGRLTDARYQPRQVLRRRSRPSSVSPSSSLSQLTNSGADY